MVATILYWELRKASTTVTFRAVNDDGALRFAVTRDDSLVLASNAPDLTTLLQQSGAIRQYFQERDYSALLKPRARKPAKPRRGPTPLEIELVNCLASLSSANPAEKAAASDATAAGDEVELRLDLGSSRSN